MRHTGHCYHTLRWRSGIQRAIGVGDRLRYEPRHTVITLATAMVLMLLWFRYRLRTNSTFVEYYFVTLMTLHGRRHDEDIIRHAAGHGCRRHVGHYYYQQCLPGNGCYHTRHTLL